jgi:hypothetical protein
LQKRAHGMSMWHAMRAVARDELRANLAAIRFSRAQDVLPFSSRTTRGGRPKDVSKIRSE